MGGRLWLGGGHGGEDAGFGEMRMSAAQDVLSTG